MKAVLVALCLAIPFCTTAENVIYDSSVSPRVNNIYWQPAQTQSAVAYARFEQFYLLRDFIDLTIMAASRTPAEGIDLTNADTLYLSFSDSEQLLEVYINSSQLVFNGYSYPVDAEVLQGFIQHNQRRINRGDLVSNKVFLTGTKSSG